jgi:hypothetical protein
MRRWLAFYPSYLELMDKGDHKAPPKFGCEVCGGDMYPEYYKGVNTNK